MQPRRLAALLAVGCWIALVTTLAGAQIYKWKDAQGVTHFSQSPPPAGTHYTRMRLAGEPEVSSNPSPAASTATPPAASPAAAQQTASGSVADTPQNRATLCKQLSSNIALLESSQSLTQAGPGGVQEKLTDTQRRQQLATARAQQAQYCNGQ